MAGYFSDYFDGYFESTSSPAVQTDLPYWPLGYWATGYWSPSYWPNSSAPAVAPEAEIERPRMPLRSRTLRRPPARVDWNAGLGV